MAELVAVRAVKEEEASYDREIEFDRQHPTKPRTRPAPTAKRQTIDELKLWRWHEHAALDIRDRTTTSDDAETEGHQLEVGSAQPADE